MNRALVWIASGIFFLSCVCTRVEASDEPIVLIGPEKIKLHAANVEDKQGWRPLSFSITNRTTRKWRFSNFYNCWHALLMSESNGMIEIRPAGRDATIPPTLADFPLLKPGKSAKATRYCRLSRDDKALSLHFSDETGGWIFEKVVPGHYKLAISYRAHFDNDVSYIATPLGVRPSDVWLGWQISNWIDLTVEPDDH